MIRRPLTRRGAARRGAADPRRRAASTAGACVFTQRRRCRSWARRLRSARESPPPRLRVTVLIEAPTGPSTSGRSSASIACAWTAPLRRGAPWAAADRRWATRTRTASATWRWRSPRPASSRWWRRHPDRVTFVVSAVLGGGTAVSGTDTVMLVDNGPCASDEEESDGALEPPGSPEDASPCPSASPGEASTEPEPSIVPAPTPDGSAPPSSEPSPPATEPSPTPDQAASRRSSRLRLLPPQRSRARRGTWAPDTRPTPGGADPTQGHVREPTRADARPRRRAGAQPVTGRRGTLSPPHAPR
jgi:hypothetical protein